MKNKKAFLWLVLIAITAASAFSQQYSPESDFDVQTIDDGKAIEITMYKGRAASVSIPPRIRNLPVTTIGGGAFDENLNITSVIIPNSVTSIGNNAFVGCTSLTSVTIGNGVTSIGLYAFWYCTSLTSVTIPNSVKSIGDYAFSDCTSLTSVTFATGSNIISENFGDSAFPEGSDGNGGNTLKTAYNTGKAGTYTRTIGSNTWTKK